MTHPLSESLAWVADGTELFTAAAAALDEDEMGAPSPLPGWSRKHVVAHVALNAEAIGRLAHWARTGEPTPMYASPEARTADIEAGARRSADDLRAWLVDSAAALDAALAGLTDEQWAAEVEARNGKRVRGTALPWMRAREVLIHSVDLGTGIGFADLPADFLGALVAEVAHQRDLPRLPEGPLPQLAAYLTGRPHALVDAPELGAWL
ncbi:maleylpyruvate isomerase family mycothiol-dependent enzyme [Nocardioides sp. GY 10113]|uniref:maleylpyruvate isomerase family mycothiol-dependent enzyme n=1 Tax=Nocardioides sp. GY 10113 TaxID=2569761 RepID=UPI0010A94C5A|nr:maleylpyruvate isomerase family mycothiol-dependent enzyme [Nocardioides sp. GY 10113]TIC88309.1 maleylpyruvate isomerase family mycothiol-dependent enzyme [Nocardioides sp. GY 10113]